ncbi:SDR family NAD(P)-dependent oxidoreductase [Amycolatopsis balhimycina DSM 5908]|uniref:SDR family NAD(P)-dependent oxidoreductase n=1 Tax=Amycolatopsis balhimycina DSM 5908 TaxID=1081091 RepID=A0A428WMJ7_AMYBA|nr:SDR family oxidoreductase [Amycolatopsis balhimycina]RSM44262.1 SDR family NAD(P)-dependent oxidoreductase [Amycolatopsis balhimycina DSM 5908]
MSTKPPGSSSRVFQGCRVLVSGGTSGVGLTAATRFAAAGAERIVVVGRNAERGIQAERSVATAGAEVRFVAGNAGDPHDSTRLAAEAAEFLGGRIDTFVSAVAPRGHLGPLQSQDPHELERVLMGLVLPVMQMNRAVLAYMQDAGGTIINIASDAAKVPTPGESVAGGAMAAIAMFSRTLALEVKRHRIRVHTVTPSLIAGTPTAERLLSEDFGANIFEKAKAKAQLGVPNADDVAETVLWLASQAAAKVTGQVISVNGGISAG